MDLANQTGGFVVGTGDLSRGALGWMTFNGDHMSMYHVNVGVPKTLVRYLVTWAATTSASTARPRRILHDIVDTPITPELLPLSSDGVVEQKTEEPSGRTSCTTSSSSTSCAAAPARRRCSSLACARVRAGVSTRRRDHGGSSCSSTGSSRSSSSARRCRTARRSAPSRSSPRGDWRMPSDASSAPWLAELAAAAGRTSRSERACCGQRTLDRRLGRRCARSASRSDRSPSRRRSTSPGAGEPEIDLAGHLLARRRSSSPTLTSTRRSSPSGSTTRPAT